MNDAQRLAVYKAQCANVRALTSARRQIKININEALRKNKFHQAETLTKSLAVVFTAWVEASFSKLIHTPHGFDLSDIAAIKLVSRKNVVLGWEKSIEVAMARHNAAASNFVQADRDRLSAAVDRLIKEPSELRNKIAHGQWMQALNSNNTDVNEVATSSITQMSVVNIDRWFDCQAKLAVIVEHLIASPNNAFINTYRKHMGELEAMYSSRSTWSVATKKALLKPKPAPSTM